MQKGDAMSSHGGGSQPKGEGPSGCEGNWPGVGSDRKEEKTEEEDERFLDLRNNLWRSPSWGSHSAPSSPRYMHTTTDDKSSHQNIPFPLTPRPLQNSRQRPPMRKALAAGSSDERREWPPPTPRRRASSRIKNGLDIKLDLGAVQRPRDSAEPTESQLKKDKFAFFDKDCSRVAEHIFIGSDALARKRETLLENKITHVLNCVGFVCPECFPDDFNYKTLWLQDSPCEDITSILYDVFDYFEEVREVAGRVFVHCCQGVSRSTSLVIAYLMWRKGRSFEDAFQDVKAARGVTNPNMGFACQLLQCQKRVHAAPFSPNSVLRMYRMAPHSPYDPLHLVPKTVATPGASALDCRGAFVVHVPSDIFVWIGKCCDARMASAAKAAANQVVKYERAEGKISFIEEGHEPATFWNALNRGCGSAEGSDSNPINPTTQQSAFAASGNRSGAIPGVLLYHSNESQQENQLNVSDEMDSTQNNLQSKAYRVSCESPSSMLIVKDYDVDYEVYNRALKGVVPPSNGLATHVPARDSGWSRLRRQVLSGSMRDILISEDSSQNLKSTSLEVPDDVSSVTGSVVASQDAKNLSDPSSIQEVPLSLGSSVSRSCTPSPSVSTASMSSPCFTQSETSNEESPYDGSPSSFELSSPAFSFSFSTPLQTDHFSNQLNSKSPSKAPPLSLAQRRGSAPPSLRLPALIDDPSTPKGPLKSVSLPSLASSEKTKDAVSNGNGVVKELPKLLGNVPDGVTNTSNFDIQQGGYSNLSKSGLLNDSIATKSRRNVFRSPTAGQAQGQPELYAWPSMEKMTFFDADNFDSQAAFILVAPSKNKDMKERNIHVYVWVGKNMKGIKDIVNQQLVWEKLGRVIPKHSQLQADIPVMKVVKEGSEPDEFWEHFLNG